MQWCYNTFGVFVVGAIIAAVDGNCVAINGT